MYDGTNVDVSCLNQKCLLHAQVAQLYGRKRWLLYPPADTAVLAPTRIPYEESSVFSQVDGRAPDLVRWALEPSWEACCV